MLQGYSLGPHQRTFYENGAQTLIAVVWKKADAQFSLGRFGPAGDWQHSAPAHDTPLVLNHK
jgi:hypothetical protein